MGFQERVTIFIETKVDSAKGGLAALKQDIAAAEGGIGKLKTAAGGIGSMLTSALTSPAGLAGVGTAIAGVAVKSVAAFQDLGLAVGKVRDATGLAAEDASRWIEVANDAGVSTDTFSSAVGRLEKNLGTNADAMAAWGVAVVTAADGTVDMNATLLNAFDVLSKIEDPTKRAAAGTAIFGKSWAQMSELVVKGSDGLTKALAAVGDAKVLGDDDVETSRELRDAMDALSDAGEALAITLGKNLAPAVTDLVGSLTPLLEAFGALSDIKIDGKSLLFTGGITGLVDAVSTTADLKGNLDLTAGSMEDVGAAAGPAADATKSLAKANKVLEARTRDAIKALQDQADQLAEQAGAFTTAADDQVAYNEALTDFNKIAKDSKASSAEVRDAAVEAAKGHQALYESLLLADGQLATTTGKLDAQNQSLLQSAATAKGPARQAILDYIGAVNGIPPEKLTDIKAAIAAGDLETAERLLNEASRSREAAITADAKTEQADADLDALAKKKRIAYIDTVLRDFGLTRAGSGNSPTGTSAPGPTVVNITMPRGANGREIDAAIARHARVNGRINALRRP
jgi:hypothetical protein